MRELKQGDTGLAVALWNTFLVSRKFMQRYSSEYEFFEVFGRETEEATKNYQKSKSLTDSGILDSK